MERREAGLLGLIAGILAIAVCANLYLGCNRKPSPVEGLGALGPSVPTPGGWNAPGIRSSIRQGANLCRGQS
jgi:hypothetical protein